MAGPEPESPATGHDLQILESSMADAFIYDHVRTPRGRGKADGALHEGTALNLATQALAAIKERNELDPKLVDDVVLGCVDPVGEAGRQIAPVAGLRPDYRNPGPRLPIQRLSRSGPGAVEFPGDQVMFGH